MIEFKLPELGENIAAGDVLRILVKPGDTLAKDQAVLELETDKATIEVPSSVVGTVTEVKVKNGEKVKVGQVILTVDGAQSSASPQPAKSETPKPEPAKAVAANSAAKVPSDEPGLEQHVEGAKRETATDKSGVAAHPAPAPARDNVVDITRGVRQTADHDAPDVPPAPAAPSVRRLARELGVDINQVIGSGTDGRMSIDDVKAHAKRLLTTAGSHGGAVPAEPLPDFSRWGEIERQAMRPVRRKTAEHLSAAWAAIPHVTQHGLADITTLEELRKKYAKQVEAAGGQLTVAAIAVKVCAIALKKFPQFNSSIDLSADEIVLKKYVNIGVAVDTDRGLLVPVIRNADQKSITDISNELSQLAEKARTRKLALDEMQGGSFSISNLGGIGGSYFTPIVNLPEVAILGISRAKMEPVYDKDSGGFEARLMLPLSLSYDHRVIDGADGARFLRWVTEAFEQPFVLAL
ncbi:MAG TPA: 2-oxo acid dehydrogenase subunit E2 [Vicinamibacterales bacterium]|nr:2-oxo acid dehydrogenase subunit E2 [Vicinamibacterales bacterium]